MKSTILMTALTLILTQPAWADHHHEGPNPNAPQAGINLPPQPVQNRAFNPGVPPQQQFNNNRHDDHHNDWKDNWKNDRHNDNRGFVPPNPAVNPALNPAFNPAFNSKVDKHGREHVNAPAGALIPVQQPVAIDYGYKHHANWQRSHNWFGSNQPIPSYVPRNYYTGIPQGWYVNPNLVSTADLDAQKTALASMIQAAAMQKRIPGGEATQLAMMLNQLNMDETNAVSRAGGNGVSINDHAMLLSELQSIANSMNGFGGYNLAINPWVYQAAF